MNSVLPYVFDIKQWFRDMWYDFNNFFDSWNSIGILIIGIILFFITDRSLLDQGFTTKLGLVIFTAAYTFVTFNQMRETRWSRKYPGTLTIRPDFEWDEEKETCKFGLRNFGAGPAINLRGCAIVRDEDTGDEDNEDALQILKNNEDSVLRFSKKDHHMSLAEGELLPLTTDSHRIDDYLDDLWENGELRDEYRGKKIEFYYTFESNTGEQYPRSWDKSTEMDLKTVVETSDSPRTVKLEEIKEKCNPISQNNFNENGKQSSTQCSSMRSR